MNIVIPMGGIGARFTQFGYKRPKPLIRIIGEPMVVWLISHLNMEEGDTLYIAMHRSVNDEHNVSGYLRHRFPAVNISTVLFDRPTRGAAETLYLVTNAMPPAHMSRRTISLDCDTIYFSDVLANVRKSRYSGGCCLYFHDSGLKPMFSYISFKDTENPRDKSDIFGRRVNGIAEKVKISDNANTGGYGFASAQLLQDFSKRILDRCPETKGELYTSAVIDWMLAEQYEFEGIFVEDFACVGTVPQLTDFLRILQTHRPDLARRQRFTFWVPGVLFEADKYPALGSPIIRNISVVRQLRQAGHEVVLLCPAAYGPSVTSRLQGVQKTDTTLLVEELLSAHGIVGVDVKYKTPEELLEEDHSLQLNSLRIVETNLEKEVGWNLQGENGRRLVS